jgi:fatty-acyl-CoA synthase
MLSGLIPIKTLSDVEEIESIPLAARGLAENTYQVFERSAERHGDRTGLRFVFTGNPEASPLNYSYREMLDRITQTANALHELGIGNHDAVSILLPLLPQNHFALWGASAIGIANPINPLLDSAHIIGIMKATQATTLVTLAPFPGIPLWDKVKNIALQVPTLKTILTVNLAQFLPVGTQLPAYETKTDVNNVTVIDFDEFIAKQSTKMLGNGCKKKSTDLACYFHTGGTTGMPKIALHTHGNEVFSAWMIGQQLNWDPEGNTKANVLCGLPLFHVNAPIVSGLAPFTVGGEVILATPQGFANKDVLKNFWHFVQKYEISFFMAVPKVYIELCKNWDKTLDVSSLKLAACGAAPMPTARIEEFFQLTGVKIREGYGLTEGTVLSAFNPSSGESKIGSIGLRIPYQKMQVVKLDEYGNFLRQCDTNEIGNIVIEGPNVFPGYLRTEDNKNIWVRKGWLNTGDDGRQDADGYFTLTGRSKDLIIRSGHNIYPQTIEEALSLHPAIAEVAVVGKPDGAGGELPIAFITLKEGQAVTSAELIAFVSDKIEYVAIPTHIYIKDKMPYTAIGKIFKPELRYEAIKLSFEETLASLKNTEMDFVITVNPHAVHGQLATVIIPENSAETLAQQIKVLLQVFAVVTEIRSNNECVATINVASTMPERPKLPFYAAVSSSSSAIKQTEDLARSYQA